MKLIKIIVATILATISFSSHAGYGAPVTTCAIRVETDKIDRFYNVNAIRYVGISKKNPKVVVINTVGNNGKDDNISISYEYEGEATIAMYNIATSIDECNREKSPNM